MVDAYVTGDLVHPGRELAPILVGVPVLEHSKKDLLHQIFAEAPVGRQPEKEVEERPLVSLEQDPETDDIPVSHIQHQRMIVSSVHVARDPDALKLRYWKLRFAGKVTGKISRGGPTCQTVMRGAARTLFP
jgi:hypothetical protein